jgi:hypothetical protein
MESQEHLIALTRYQNWLLEQLLFATHSGRPGECQELIYNSAAGMNKARTAFGLPERVIPGAEPGL